ncbi:MAG TPA: hypothetical protein VMS01_06465 [Stellaceae bacterium]|nr:hypothetical protein [Stellaceae bacterium]
MSGLEQRLAAIGHRAKRQPADCWRVERIGPSRGLPVGRRPAPVRGRALSRWLDRLRDSDRRQTTAYRIALGSELK